MIKDCETALTESSLREKKIQIYLYSIAVGISSGLIIVLYRTTISLFEQFRAAHRMEITASPVKMLLALIVSLCCGLLVAYLVNKAPLIKGSGIPQIKASLLRRIKLDWKKELPFKLIGGSLALGMGFSVGREGPSVQLGALAGDALAKLSKRHDYSRHLITAGAAAGISAAFNAPLAGVLFCLEELHRNISPVILTSSLISAFSANIVMSFFYGNSPVFSVKLLHILPLALYPSAILVIGIATGLLGSLFNRGLIFFQRVFARIAPAAELRIIIAFPLVAAVALIFPLVAGGGDKLVAYTGKEGIALSLIFALLAGKVLFTLFSYASGAPGGIFLPMLSIGSLIGAASGTLLLVTGAPDAYYNNYLLLGMVGFFTAVVRAPITGAVLITEMGGSFSHFPAFILVSVIASLVAEALNTRPIYDLLLKQVIPHNHSSNDPRPVVLHIPVHEGATLETCEHALKRLPEDCILVSVERGEDEIFPDGKLDIQPGDVLHVLVEKGKASKLKERLLALASAPGENS